MQKNKPQPKKTFSEQVKEIEKNPPSLRVKLLVEAARRTRETHKQEQSH